MNVLRTTRPSFNRRILAPQAMQAAAGASAKANLNQAGPICINGLCEMLRVWVRFRPCEIRFRQKGSYNLNIGANDEFRHGYAHAPYTIGRWRHRAEKLEAYVVHLARLSTPEIKAL